MDFNVLENNQVEQSISYNTPLHATTRPRRSKRPLCNTSLQLLEHGGGIENVERPGLFTAL